MRLGERLKCVASYVPEGAKLADVGTDHAYLPVWLTENGVINFAIATDIAAGPCSAARASIERAGLTDKIKVRRGDGLAAVQPGEVDTVVIAGMGASNIIGILQKATTVLDKTEKLILQPMAESVFLRRWLHANGWRVEKEKLAKEAERIYEIISAIKSAGDKYEEWEYQTGRLQLREKDPLWCEYMGILSKKHNFVLKEMEKSNDAAGNEKYREYQKLVAKLEELLKCQ